MLTIRDHKNNEYPLLAVKTVTEDLNSNPVLELKIPKQNNLDLKLIDKLWEINYQTVDYKIMYVKQVTKGDSFYLDVRAIPLFYWDFDKLIVHENKDGHYTGVNAFTDLFNGTGYQYVLVDFVEAIQIEGYGKGETRLEMFKRLIERFGLEFYIVGKTVYLRKLIGNDTNFQYRYKLNASNVSKSIDASNYFTHIKGFGNFEEGSENYLKDTKLKREYTSPLASVLGVYEGKPIVDGRIKDTATMDAILKKAVEESLEISIEGNLHDVRSIYAEAVPTIGDRVFLIDERIGLEQEIRIHTLKRTYDVNDKLIDCEVTFGSQNIRDRYKSNLNSAAKDFTALMKGDIKLPTWSLDEIARGMITKIHASENELKYGSFGIQAIDKNNPNNVFGLNSQGWYISTDGGATARTIATAEGILAESIIGNHLIGLQLTSPGESGYFHVTGSDAEFVNTSNNRKVKISPDGVYGYNANGDIRFQMDRELVTSAALGTSNSNVYLATDTGFEARVVDRNQLPGSGAINDYTYRPMRALIYRFPDVPNAYFTLYNGGEFRFTGESTSNPVYQDVRANVFHGAGFRTTTTNLYLGTDNLVHVVNKGFVDGSTGSPIYRDLRANDIYNRAMITSSTHAYIGSDGELRVVNKGLSGIYRDIRFSSSYSTTGNYYGINDNVLKINSGFIQSESMYTRTYSYTANMYVTSNGIVGRATSARKYKLAIEHQFRDWQEQLNHSKKMLEVRPSTWFDRFEAETYAEEIKLGERIDEEDFKVKRHFGAIADEFHELGLTELVQYNEDDEVEGLSYDRMSVHHNVLIKDLYDENDTLKTRIEKLEEIIYATK